MKSHSNKEVYRLFCNSEPSIPLFSRDWWLDAMAGEENWDVAVVEKGGAIQAALPYVIKKRTIFTVSSQPPLTQTLGPWIRPTNSKYAKALGRQKKLLKELIDQLPEFDYFYQNWRYTQSNWQPFYWAGYKQATSYTYVINDLSDHGQIWNGFTEKVRTDIKKSLSRYQLKIMHASDVEDFIILNRKVFERQQIDAPYSEESIRKLDKVCRSRSARKIFIAVDQEGRAHAGIYIVWDQHSAYYLMGGGDPELRNSGATSLCLWEAIKFASGVTRSFDFEGSMNESIERFFRGFGAHQIPFFSVSKTTSRLLRLRECLLEMVK